MSCLSPSSYVKQPEKLDKALKAGVLTKAAYLSEILSEAVIAVVANLT